MLGFKPRVLYTLGSYSPLVTALVTFALLVKRYTFLFLLHLIYLHEDGAGMYTMVHVWK